MVSSTAKFNSVFFVTKMKNSCLILRKFCYFSKFFLENMSGKSRKRSESGALCKESFIFGFPARLKGTDCRFRPGLEPAQLALRYASITSERFCSFFSAPSSCSRLCTSSVVVMVQVLFLFSLTVMAVIGSPRSWI